MTIVWTAQYRYNGPDRLDITVKSGGGIGKAFAPTWQMVMEYKNGQKVKAPNPETYRTMMKQLQDNYTRMYEQMMRESLANNRMAWDWLLSQRNITLVCFCPAGEFCHRVILARDILKGAVDYKGERRL